MKKVSLLWAGVVVSVGCLAAVRVGPGYSLLGLNGGVASTRLSTFSSSKLPPKFVADLNGYGFGNDSLHWTWDAQKASVFVNLRLSAAALRYYYPSLIWYGQRLHTICTDGAAPLKYWRQPYTYVWTPYWAMNGLFDDYTEKEFIKSWRNEIDGHIYRDVWDKAWAKNLGVLYTLQVGQDGKVINSAMSLDTSHRTKTATEGGATGVIGDNKFPGNQMKIFFDGALSRMIADQLDTPEKFTNWLLNNTSGVKPYFPAREALKRALKSDGSWIPHWSEQPVWGTEKDEVNLLKKVISSGDHFTQIRSMAEKVASKDTGMVIKIVRRTIDVCDFVVERQGSPRIYLTDDGFTAKGSFGDDRSYSCTFSWKDSVRNLYLSNKSNIFYNRLTAYAGTDYDWALGQEFRDSEIGSDLDDIQEIVNDTEWYWLINLNQYISWSHFQEMLQHALWYHQRINIKFNVFYSGPFGNNWYKVYVNWWGT